MSFTTIALLLFLNGVLANFTVSYTPTSVIECQELQVSWTGGDGALTFWSTPDILANNATIPITDLGEQSSPFNWPAVNITSGTAVTIIIQNSTSDLSSTSGDNSFVVGTGPDTSCLSLATSSNSTSLNTSRTRISSSTSTSTNIGQYNEDRVTFSTTQTGISRITLVIAVLVAIVGTTLILLLIHTALRYRKQRAKRRPKPNSRPSGPTDRIDPFLDPPRGDQAPLAQTSAEIDKGPGESESVLAIAGSFLSRISTRRSTNTDANSTRLAPPPKKKSRQARGYPSTETMNPVVENTGKPQRDVPARDGEGEGQGRGYDIHYLVREMGRLKARLDALTSAQGNVGSWNRTENGSENLSTKPPTYRSRTTGSE
ncbi:uncharacterized protein STEHIDRAFT_159284 [Stereum hirsutum FP-91666 SS1]|uniref:uncharacterized protein n=1 Tax=Stereum hirsutum (strain FP-91666) TaxID=721885 RepID=UPI00044494E6|nr:uncharacterized protein STEHIDRAFT_159284 [Stereum hirsutum FP-91666 SS1]EIM84619.1 hypothetical protein STEHIDRAFT_159284 [Stereum hirsutum FP-91666 SS1]